MATRSIRSGSRGSRNPIGKHGDRHQGSDRTPKRGPLAMAERLLRQAEVPSPSPPHLDDDQGGRRPRVHGEQVHLVPSEPEVAGEDLPTLCLEPSGDQRLRRVPDPLCRRRAAALHGDENRPRGLPPPYPGCGKRLLDQRHPWRRSRDRRGVRPTPAGRDPRSARPRHRTAPAGRLPAGPGAPASCGGGGASGRAPGSRRGAPASRSRRSAPSRTRDTGGRACPSSGPGPSWR